MFPGLIFVHPSSGYVEVGVEIASGSEGWKFNKGKGAAGHQLRPAKSAGTQRQLPPQGASDCSCQEK